MFKNFFERYFNIIFWKNEIFLEKKLTNFKNQDFQNFFWKILAFFQKFRWNFSLPLLAEESNGRISSKKILGDVSTLLHCKMKNFLKRSWPTSQIKIFKKKNLKNLVFFLTFLLKNFFWFFFYAIFGQNQVYNGKKLVFLVLSHSDNMFISFSDHFSEKKSFKFFHV